MEEKIGKVTLNYDFYQGDDSYSDGDIEEKLLEIAKSNSGTELEKRIAEEDDWAVLYHFSDIRRNILEWYDMKEGASVLEIGAGCGAVTGVLADKAASVTCIDLSKRRSMINAERNRDKDNITIYVGNFKDISLDKKFDYVTLIGVLEYSIYYVGGENPFMEMLKRAKDYLAPGGKLIVAIENKYGLKYWAGAAEDHTGKRFDGITGYAGVDRVRTFSRQKLEEMLRYTGFTDTAFYYPVPDYKMPVEIYSDKKLPKKGSIKSISPNYDRERYLYFDEVKAYDSICEDGMFPFFANSFLVIAGTEREVGFLEVLYAKYNRLRSLPYRMETRIVRRSGARYVDKRMLDESGSIERLGENRELLRKLYRDIKSVQGTVKGSSISFPYVKGKPLGTDIDFDNAPIDDIMAKLKDASELIQNYNFDCISEFEMTEGFRDTFNVKEGSQLSKALMELKDKEAVCPANLDEIMSNFIVTEDDGLYVIDYEWVTDFPVPISYITYRIYHYAYHEHRSSLEGRISYDDFMKEAGFTEEVLKCFAALEKGFQRKIYGTDPDKNYTSGYSKPVHDIDLLLQHKDNLLLLKTQQYEAQCEKLEKVRHAIRNPVYGAGLIGGKLKQSVGKKTDKTSRKKKQ